MSDQCATSTLFSSTVVTSTSLSTSFTTLTVTGTPEVITTSTAVCASTTAFPITLPGSSSTSTSATCASSSFSTFTTTIIGTPTTSVSSTIFTEPVTFTTSVPTATTTSCPTTTPTTTPSPPTSDPTSDSTTTPTPPPTTTTSETTLSNGSISTVTYTLTVPPDRSPGLVPPPGGGGGDSKVGTIVGATVGTVAGLTALALIAWWFWRRRSRWDDIFEDEQDALRAPPRKMNRLSRRTSSFELEPAPYHYGLVGASAPAPTQASSPPHSPRLRTGHSRLPSSPLGSVSLPPGALPPLGRSTSVEPHTSVATSSSGGMSPQRFSTGSHVLVDPWAVGGPVDLTPETAPLVPLPANQSPFHDPAMGPAHRYAPPRHPSFTSATESHHSDVRSRTSSYGGMSQGGPARGPSPSTQTSGSASPMALPMAATTSATAQTSRPPKIPPGTSNPTVIVHRDGGPAPGSGEPSPMGSPVATPHTMRADEPPAYTRE